ncbi:MAG: hypothetical protein HZA53_01850 [Planctomycetes bacterium]|nr:hypothetical protein [Planctomycetota bacterium]
MGGRVVSTTRRKARTGITVLEVTISIAILSMFLLGSAAAYVGVLRGAKDARRTSRAGVYLASVMEDLAAEPYDNLAGLNGSTFHDQPTVQGSAFVVELSVFPAAVNLLQLRAIVKDPNSNRELARVVTLRCNP